MQIDLRISKRSTSAISVRKLELERDLKAMCRYRANQVYQLRVGYGLSVLDSFQG